MSNRLNLNEYINVDEVKVTDDSATLIGIDKNGDLAVVPNDFNEIKEDIKTLDEKIDAIDVSVYATKEEVNTAKKDLEAEITASKKEAVSESQKYTDAAKSALNSEISKKADKTYVDSEVKSAKTAAVSESKSYTDTVKKSLNDEIAKKANADSVNSQFSQINSTLNKKADKSEIPTDYVSKKDFDNAIDKKADKSALDGKQDKLVSGTNIKTINGKSILGEGNIVIEGGSGEVVDAYTKEESDNKFATKTELSGYQVKGDYATKSEIPSLEGYATESYVNDAVSKVEVDAYTKEESDAKYGTKTEQESLRSDVEDVMGEVATLEADKANKSDLDKYATKEEVPTEFKTINGETILGEGNIEIKGGSEPVDAYTKAESDEKFATKGEVPTPQTGNYGSDKNYVYSQPSMSGNKGVLNDIQYTPDERRIEVKRKWWNDTSNSYTDYINAATQSKAGVMSAQDKTKLDNAPTEFKTINGEPIVGSGNIEISSGETIDAYTKTEADNKFATKGDIDTIESEIRGVENNFNETLKGFSEGLADIIYTKEDADEKFATKTELSGYQVKGDYATQEEFANLGNMVNDTIQGFSEAISENVYTKEDVDGKIKEINDELADKVDSATLDGYATKQELTQSIENKADKTEITQLESEIAGKQDELVSGTNIKTINGTSILGEGDIEIQGGSGSSKVYHLTAGTTDENKEYCEELAKGNFPPAFYTTNNGVDKIYLVTRAYYYPTKTGNYLRLASWFDPKTNHLDAYTGDIRIDADGTIKESNIDSLDNPKTRLYNSVYIDKTFATKTELDNKQDILVSGTNIKTINGEPVIGSGNIEIKGGSEPVDAYTKAESDAKYGTKTEQESLRSDVEDVMGEVATLEADKADKSELEKYATKQYVEDEVGGVESNLNSTIQGIAQSVTEYTYSKEESDNKFATKEEVPTEFKTINGESILGEGNIEISGGSGGSKVYHLTVGTSDENQELYDLLSANIENTPTIIIYDTDYYNVIEIEKSSNTFVLYVYKSSSLIYNNVFYVKKYGYQLTDGGILKLNTALSNQTFVSFSSGNSYLSLGQASGSVSFNIKQTNLEAATATGQGLADAYNVKAYIDSQIGDIDSALDAILNPA